jgi:hypothetical protein
LPHSAPAAHGSGVATFSPTGGQAQPNLFPGGNQSSVAQPGSDQTQDGRGAGGTSDSGGTTSGDIFDTGSGARKTYQSDKRTSALNLLSQLEKWGVNAGAKVTNVTLTVDVSTGAQLADLIKKLPADGVHWDLQLEKED